MMTFTDDAENVFNYKYEFYGAVTETPAPSGVDDEQFATIVEYSCENDIDNAEMCVLDVNGYVMVLHGSDIQQNDINILNQ